MKKKAQALAIWIIVLCLAIGIGGATFVGYQKGWFSKEQQAVGEVEKQVTVKESQSCSGIASTKLLYNDQNAYKAGTDPATNMTVYNPARILVQDDATTTTGDVLTHFSALAGNNIGQNEQHYFADDIEFDTICSDVPIQPDLYQAGAPTISVVGDDGVTKMSSTTGNETVIASGAYTATFSVKAPAEKCSAVYGAVIACEYDATYVNTLTGVGLTDRSFGIYIPHGSRIEATWDQWKTFEWNGAVQDVNKDNINDAGYLCDGAKTEFDIDYAHTSTSASGSGANIRCHWLPINKDLDADKYVVLTNIYDEDNNEIFIGNQTGEVYTTA